MINPTRQKLIMATEHLLRKEGLALITIRKIAREAGVAEGTLYHYFKDKAELLHAVVQSCMGEFREVLESLPLLVGQKSVEENLENVLEVAFDFQFQIVPIVCSLYADHQLLARTREIMTEREIGPQCSVRVLTSYLECEQRLGRVDCRIDPHAVAELLLAGSFYRAMMDHFLDRKIDRKISRQHIHEKVCALLKGLEPRLKQNPLPSTGTKENETVV